LENKLEIIETITHLLSEHAEHPLVLKHQESLNKIMFLLNFNELFNVEIHPSTLQKIQEIYDEVHSEELEDAKELVVWESKMELVSTIFNAITQDFERFNGIERIEVEEFDCGCVKLSVIGDLSGKLKEELNTLFEELIETRYPTELKKRLTDFIVIENDKTITATLPLSIKVVEDNSEINKEETIVTQCDEAVETEIDSEVLISDAEKDFAQLLETSGLDALIKGEDDGVVIIYKTFGEKLFMTQFETLVNINLSEMEYDLATSFSAILEKEVESDSLYIVGFSDSSAVFVTDGVGNPILLGVYDSDKVGYFED
jgi:hypothetical protein